MDPQRAALVIVLGTILLVLYFLPALMAFHRLRAWRGFAIFLVLFAFLLGILVLPPALFLVWVAAGWWLSLQCARGE